MKVPPKRKGNTHHGRITVHDVTPSMKVPPKRKGNAALNEGYTFIRALNESPSEKEGKFDVWNSEEGAPVVPSMKVPPKRKGNDARYGC